MATPLIILKDLLYVDQPGAAAPALRRMATFARVGRLRLKQKRVVHYYRYVAAKDRLILPRGLVARVHEALPATQILDQRLTVPPADFGLKWALRDYQEAAVGAIIAQEGGVVVAAPGSGKTIMGLALAARWRQPTLFLVHTLRLVKQTEEKARAALALPRRGLGIVADSAKDYGSHLTIATIQTLAKNPRYVRELATRVGTVIVDECVVAESLVDGVPIRYRRVGDIITTYDPATGSFSRNPITHVFTRPAPDTLIRVSAAGRSLVCTPNHPIWTKRGWVNADRLAMSDYLLAQDNEWKRIDGLWPLDSRDRAYREACPDGLVYNLEVAEDHTFLANGIVTHNCHHTPSDSFQKVVNSFPARHRAGLSATPTRDDGLGGMVTAILGPRVVIPRAILRERGVIIDPQIMLVDSTWVAPEGGSHAQAEKARALDPGRNALLAQLVWLARSRKQRVLVLVEREIHATRLAALLTKGGVPAWPVMGRLPTPLQDKRFELMEQGRAVVVATKLANEGLDWPALDCLVLATPGRSPTVLEQRTGRIARTSPGKTFALVYDVADPLSPVYLAQAQARLQYYKTQGYRVRRMTWPRNPT